ncbi:hypothetical protein BDR07DRAFT_1444354 [Suillus spraguei]|nr:hypothetical protein BDR07DRAFT_1444354 [Suillus spraguei]
MSLVRTLYDPFADFDKLFDDAFNARFHRVCSPTVEGNTALIHRRDGAFPRMDLYENAEAKTVTAAFELPGVKQEDVNVEVHGNRLTISGESKRSENFNKGNHVGINAEDVHAKMENGAGADQQPQRIAIA